MDGSLDLIAGVSETPLGRTGLNFWVGFAPMHNSAQQIAQTNVSQSREDLIISNLETDFSKGATITDNQLLDPR